MMVEPQSPAIVWLLAAKVICCGGILLAVGGAVGLAGIADWLLDGGIIWPAVAILAIVAIYLWWRHAMSRRQE